MADRPTENFEWATNGGSAITPAPDSTVRATGFGKTFVPFQWLNQMLNHIGKHIAWFDQQERSHDNTLVGHANSISTLFDHYNASEKVKAHGKIVIPFSGFNPAINDGKVDATIEYIIHRHPITGASSLVTLIFPETIGDPTNSESEFLHSYSALPETVLGFDDQEINLRPAQIVYSFVHVIGSGGTNLKPGSVSINTTGMIHFYQLHSQEVSIPPATISLVKDQSSFEGVVNNKGFGAFTITYKAAE